MYLRHFGAGQRIAMTMGELGGPIAEVLRGWSGGSRVFVAVLLSLRPKGADFYSPGREPWEPGFNSLRPERADVGPVGPFRAKRVNIGSWGFRPRLSTSAPLGRRRVQTASASRHCQQSSFPLRKLDVRSSQVGHHHIVGGECDQSFIGTGRKIWRMEYTATMRPTTPSPIPLCAPPIFKSPWLSRARNILRSTRRSPRKLTRESL